MSHTAVTNGNRIDAMALLLKVYDEWPDKSHPIPEGHVCGYHWRKHRPNADWCLMDSNNDVISKAEFHVEYFEAIRMTDHFNGKEAAALKEQLEEFPDKKGYSIKLTRNQLRAMGHAIAVHDANKDKLHAVAVVSNRLNKVLTQ